MDRYHTGIVRRGGEVSSQYVACVLLKTCFRNPESRSMCNPAAIDSETSNSKAMENGYERTRYRQCCSRTPLAAYQRNALQASLTATDLGGFRHRCGYPACGHRERIGQRSHHGAGASLRLRGQNPAKQAAVKAGMPWEGGVPDRSTRFADPPLKAVMLAAHAIARPVMRIVVVAGGMESP